MSSQKISDLPLGAPSGTVFVAGYDSSLPSGAQNVRVAAAELGSIATTLMVNGSAIGTLVIPASAVSNGTLTLAAASAPLTLGGVAVGALDPALFTLSAGGTATLLTSNFGSLAAAGTLTGAGQVLVVSNGVGSIATLAQIAAESELLTQPAISINLIANPVSNQPFTYSGVLTNREAPPTLYAADDSGAFAQVTGTITSTGFTITHPGMASGAHLITLRDQDNNQAISNSFTAAPAVATAASFTSAPSSGVAGSAISGATGTLTPSYATAYAALDTGGADQGARVSFTGTAIPAFTPSGAGTYQLVIYAALTGGTALATSGNITVSATPATGATIAGTPASGTTGTGISGVTSTLTPAGSTAYAVLYTGSADEGTRQAFTGSTVPTLTPASTGTYTIKIYAALTGGAALATSSAITVTATATAATVAGAPASGYQGTAITGLTDTLTPSNATAYAVLSVGGADEGTRQAFTGTSVPSLTPASTGSYTVKIYAALTGGVALATSSAIAVTILATAATIAGAPASGSQGSAITGLTDTLTPAGATGYAVLYTGSADEGTRVAFTGTSVPSLTPASTGSYTVRLYAALTGGAALATSSAITVTATATAATIAGAPASGTKGTAITGVTDTLTPSNATAYAVLALAGVDEGTRVAFTGTSVPSLTPQNNGSYTIKIYPALTGGTALATSSAFTVTTTATAATIAGAPTTGNKGTAITGVTDTLTPAGATGFAVLALSGTDEGTRVSFTGTSVPSLTPQNTGTYAIKIYAALTGGTALATSGNITVSGASAPSIGSSVAPSMILDASSGNVFTDTGYTTVATNGAAVKGWKDSTANAVNVSNSSSVGTLVTNSQNSLPGIALPAATAGVLSNTTAGLLNSVRANLASATGVTFAVVFKADAILTGSQQNTVLSIGTDVGDYAQVQVNGGNMEAGIHDANAAGYQNAFVSQVAAGTLMKFVATFTKNAVSVSVNAIATNTDSGFASAAFTNTFTYLRIGNAVLNSSPANITLYECDVWLTAASGTGGATPTGDIATIMNYLTTKWGS